MARPERRGTRLKIRATLSQLPRCHLEEGDRRRLPSCLLPCDYFSSDQSCWDKTACLTERNLFTVSNNDSIPTLVVCGKMPPSSGIRGSFFGTFSSLLRPRIHSPFFLFLLTLTRARSRFCWTSASFAGKSRVLRVVGIPAVKFAGSYGHFGHIFFRRRIRETLVWWAYHVVSASVWRRAHPNLSLVLYDLLPDEVGDIVNQPTLATPSAGVLQAGMSARVGRVPMSPTLSTAHLID